MKKVILFLGLFLMMAATSNAQADFSFGPKLGYKANSLSINRGDLMLYPKGYVTLGVFGRIMIKDFIIQPELMYNYSELYEGSVTVVLNSNIHPGERHNADTDRLNTFSITLGYRFGK
ncbi:MAG: PorT family protein [Lentimicrobiaceae bacterium]|nr:PorT family protein [Lentimicrobiaceae bacterium]